MADENPRLKLYNNLIASKKVTSDDIGDFKTFDSLLNDEGNASKLYTNLTKSKKFSASDLGDQNTFVSLTRKKKEQSEVGYEAGFQKAERERKEIPTQAPYKSAEQVYKETPITPKQPKVEEGSYANLPSKILEGASNISLKPLAMISDMLLPVARELLPSQAYAPVEKILEYPKEAVGRIEQETGQYNLPDTMMGNITTGVATTVPLVASLMAGNPQPLLGQIGASQAPVAVQLINNTAMSPLTKLLAAEKASEKYLEKEKEGKGYAEKMAQIPEGVLAGVKESFTLAGYGGLARRITPIQLGELAKRGLIAGDGKITESLLNTLNMGTVFGASSAVDDIIQGNDVDVKKALENAGVAMALEIPHLKASVTETATQKVKEFVGNKAIMEAAKNGASDKNAIINFAQAPQEAIDRINSMKETHQELFNKSIEHGIEGVNSKDLNAKKEQITAQILTQKASDIKYISELIKNDYDGFIDKVNQLKIPLEQKAELINKVNTIKANEGVEKEVVKEQNVESKKAEIEAKREQELETNKKASELNPEVGAEDVVANEINAKYDAELAKIRSKEQEVDFEEIKTEKQEVKFETVKHEQIGGGEEVEFVKIGNPYIDVSVSAKTNEATEGLPVSELTNKKVIDQRLSDLYSDRELIKDDFDLKKINEAISFLEKFSSDSPKESLKAKKEIEVERPKEEYEQIEKEFVASKPLTATEARKAEIQKELEIARNEFRIALGSTANFSGPINAIVPLVKIAKLHIESGLLTAKEIATKLREEYKAMGLDDSQIPDHQFKNLYVKALNEYKKTANMRNPLKITDKEVSTATPDMTKIDNANAIIKERLDARAKKTFKNVINKVIRKTSESQIGVLKTLRAIDKTGLTEASFRTKLGYTNKAADFTQSVGNEVFGGLSGKENVTVNGRKTSEYNLLNTSITLQRVIGIDTFIDAKVEQFNKLGDKIATELAKSKGQIDYDVVKKLVAERDGIKKYLVHNEVLEYNPQTKTYKQLLFKHPEGLNKELAEKELADFKKDNPELYKKIQDRVDKYDKAQKKLLQEKLDAELITKEQFDALSSVFYAPRRYSEYLIEEGIDRLSDIQSPNSPMKNLNKGIQALKGGSTDLISSNYQELLNLSALSTYKSIYEQHSVVDVKNLIGKQNSPFLEADIAKNKDGSDIVDSFGNPTYAKAKEGYDFIDYYEQGIKKKFQAPSEFVQEYYYQHQPSAVLNALGRASLVQVFKGAITGYNPTFGLFQLLQDGPSAIMNSRAYGDAIYGTGVFLKNTPASFKAAFTKNALYKEAAEFGSFTDLISDYGDVLGLKSKSQTRNSLEALGKRTALFNEAMEYTTRINVYKTMRDKLVNQYESKNKTAPTGQELRNIKVIAAGEARSVIDFSRGGTFAKDLNQVVPYLNPAIQASRAAFESFSKNPYRFIAKSAEIASMATLLMAYSMGDLLSEDEEEKKKRLDAYMSLNEYQRVNYFNIWNPSAEDKKHQWIKINKPVFLRGILNTAEQFYLGKYKGHNIEEGQIARAFAQLGPYDMNMLTSNPIINGYIKYGFNKDPYTKKDVVRDEKTTLDYLEGVDDSSVSTIYKKLGGLTYQAGLGEGLSPKRTQGVVESFIGNPDRNLYMSIGNKLVLAPIYYLSGKQKELDEMLGGSTGEFLGKTTGFNSRLFNKTPDVDPRIFESINKKVMERNRDKMFLNMEIKQIIDANKDVSKQKEEVLEYLTEKVHDKEIDKEQKKRLYNNYFNAPELTNAPDWYKVIKYVQSSEDKAEMIKGFMKDDKRKESEILQDLIKRKVISKEVALKVKRHKPEPEEEEE